MTNKAGKGKEDDLGLLLRRSPRRKTETKTEKTVEEVERETSIHQHIPTTNVPDDVEIYTEGAPSDIMQPTPIHPPSLILDHRPKLIFNETLRLSQLTQTTFTASISTTRTRSTSPIKRSEDLLKLKKPVQWRKTDDLRDLRDQLSSDPDALELFGKVHRLVERQKGYLPSELREFLGDRFWLGEDDDGCFAPRGDEEVSEEDKARVELLQKAKVVADVSFGFHTIDHLWLEYNTLRKIVSTTKDFIAMPRSEASWNSSIHSRVLELALQDFTSVVAEDVTRANIAKSFIPPARQNLELPIAGSKMIDYVLALRSNRDIVDFVGDLEHKTFNQTSYPPLCTAPTGVFIETKVDTRRCAEGQSQLGMWLASWLERISSFPAKVPVPCLPLLLVVADDWQLWFAIDQEDRVDVFGPVNLGKTSNLQSAYRVLGALRVLGAWMETEFQEWVRQILNCSLNN